jgi:hypothetical protein
MLQIFGTLKKKIRPNKLDHLFLASFCRFAGKACTNRALYTSHKYYTSLNKLDENESFRFFGLHIRKKR